MSFKLVFAAMITLSLCAINVTAINPLEVRDWLDFTEGSGNTLNNNGTGSDYTITGSPTWSADAPNSLVGNVFLDTSVYATSIGNEGLYDNYTVAFWHKINDTCSINQYAGSATGDGFGSDYNNCAYSIWNDAGSYYEDTVTQNRPSNQWVHVVFARSGTDVMICVDAQCSSGTLPLSSSTGDVVIGYSPNGNPSQASVGSEYAQLIIVNKKINQDEVDALYAGGNGVLYGDFGFDSPYPNCDISFTNTPCNAAGMTLDSSYENYVLSDVYVDGGELTITSSTGAFTLSGNVTMVGYRGRSFLRFDTLQSCNNNLNLNNVNLNVILSSPTYRPEITLINQEAIGSVNIINPDNQDARLDMYTDAIDPNQCGVVTARMQFDSETTGEPVAVSGEFANSVLLERNQVTVNNPSVSGEKGLMNLEGTGVSLAEGYKMFHNGALAVENTDYTVTNLNDDGTYFTQAFFIVNEASGVWNMYNQSFTPSEETGCTDCSVTPPSTGGGGRITGRATTVTPTTPATPVVAPSGEPTLWSRIVELVKRLFK